MSTHQLTHSELKAGIRTLLENDPPAFFALLREVRDEMRAAGTIDTTAPAEPATEGDKLRAEVETDLGMLADFFRGFA